MIRKLFILLFLLAFVGAFSAQAAETLPNAGFARGGILFSKDLFFAGDKVRVYTVVFNGSTEDLSGTAEFYDNGAAFGRTDFTAKGGGTVRDVWVDWTAASGAHSITAKIVKAQAAGVGGASQAVVLAVPEVGAAQIAVDSDLNKNGIGDQTDHELQLQKAATEEAALAREIASTTAATGAKLGTLGAIVGTTTANAVFHVAQGASKILETARTAGEKWATEKSAALKSELAASAPDAKGNSAKIKNAQKSPVVPDRPFKFAYQFAAAALGFILASRWLTYGALTLTLYFFLKVLYRWLLRR